MPDPDPLPEVRGEGTSPADAAGTPADPRLYFAARGQTGATLSPDGRRVAYLDRTTGSPQVWTVDRPLGWPRQVTRFPHRATLARWAPAGDRLLVAGDLGGDERDDLLLVRPDGGWPLVLARGADGRNQAGGFTPDGSRLVFASTRRHAAFFDVWVADAASGETRLVHEDDGLNWVGEVSPDGRRVLVLKAFGSFHQEPSTVDLVTGERTPLLPGAPPANWENPRWSADGRSVLLTTDLGRDFLAVARVTPGGGRPEILFAPEADVDTFDLSPATGWMAWTVNDRGLSRLYARRVGDGGAAREVLSGGVVGSPPAFAARAPVLVVGWGTATRPASLVRVDLSESPPRLERMTEPDLGGVDPSLLVDAGESRFPSFDGLEIGGFLHRAPGDCGTCVVVVHGGPESQSRPSFYPLVQLLAARGHSVFLPNVRGSTGYGRAFAALDDGRRRMESVADLAAVHAHLVGTGIARRDRVAVIGGSYGGFMVLAALTHQPDLWAAGVSVVGIAHLGTFLRNTSAFRQRHRAAEYGDPVRDADFFEETAPVRHAHRIRAPLMVIQGKNDPRVPVSEAEQIVAAARANGVPVEYLLYGDEGHGLSRLENQVDAYGRAADFLDRALAS